MPIVLGRFARRGMFVETIGVNTITNTTNDTGIPLTIIKSNNGTALKIQGKEVLTNSIGGTITLSPIKATPGTDAFLTISYSTNAKTISLRGDSIVSTKGNFLQTNDNVSVYGLNTVTLPSTSLAGNFAIGIPLSAIGSSFNIQLLLSVLVTVVTVGTVTLTATYTDLNGNVNVFTYPVVTALGNTSLQPLYLNVSAAGVAIAWTVTGTITFNLICTGEMIFVNP